MTAAQIDRDELEARDIELKRKPGIRCVSRVVCGEGNRNDERAQRNEERREA